MLAALALAVAVARARQHRHHQAGRPCQPVPVGLPPLQAAGR